MSTFSHHPSNHPSSPDPAPTSSIFSSMNLTMGCRLVALSTIFWQCSALVPVQGDTPPLPFSAGSVPAAAAVAAGAGERQAVRGAAAAVYICGVLLAAPSIPLIVTAASTTPCALT